MDENIKTFMKKLKKISGFSNVKFIFLYGSRTTGKANKLSDYDFAVYYSGTKKNDLIF